MTTLWKGDARAMIKKWTTKTIKAIWRAIVLAPGRAHIAWGWRSARKAWIAEHPYCAACGHTPKRGSNDVHHILPRHVAPDLAGVSGNFITLCRRNNCHLVYGHFGNYRTKWNPDIIRILRDQGGRMIAARETFETILAMTPDEREAAVTGVTGFNKRLDRLTRKKLPPLGAVEPDGDFTLEDLEGDLRGMLIAREIHDTRVQRLLDLGLVVRRGEISGKTFSMTKRGKRFLKKPSWDHLRG